MEKRLNVSIIRNLICFLILLFVSKNAIAQDTIVQTNGTKIIAVVQEVGTTEIRYKKYENRQTSPVYTINRKAVKMIKYADGTKDEFIDGTNVKDLPPPVKHEPDAEKYKPAGEPFKEGLNKPVFKQRYVYFGVRTSLANGYSGGGFNKYWTDLFAAEVNGGGDGATQLNEGSPTFNEIFIGNSLPLSANDHLNIEVQLAFSAKHAWYNTAVFLDGTNGDMYFDLFGVNISGQYMHGIDPGGNFQVGGEFGLDYGMVVGSETDAFATSGSNIDFLDRTYSGSGFGAHLAVVGKYFFGVRKMFGVELRAGYRVLQTAASSTYGFSTDPNAYPPNNSLNVGWSGAFLTGGVILQIRAPNRR